jgi:hypothetical protein
MEREGAFRVDDREIEYPRMCVCLSEHHHRPIYNGKEKGILQGLSVSVCLCLSVANWAEAR